MNTIEIIKENAILLNKLSTNENELFEYINKRQENLEEVISNYKPERDFKPVNTLRFLIANELKKGNILDPNILEQLKAAIEKRDVSRYYDLNDSVKQSLINYKNSKVGMFPNWKHAFKILFPFIHNSAKNEEIKNLLNKLANNIIEDNGLENVTKHIVSFQGSQNYGSDRVWVAIIPKTAPSVQYAYQLFFTIDLNGLTGGIHKGHNLTKQKFQNQDLRFNVWDDYLNHTINNKDEWSQLNSKVDFIFIKDQKEFEKTVKKGNINALSNYFNILDSLKEDLDIQDEERFVFSIAKNRLSFQVGKRYCLNVKKETFDYISNKDSEPDNSKREVFSGEESTYLYNDRKFEEVLDNYKEIKFAVENEIERDNHALAKSYDNSAFRKALFDKEYRENILNQNGTKNKYYLVGAYWDDRTPMNQTERFVNEGIWENGYEDKFLKNVNEVAVGSFIAIKSAFTREKTKSVMSIKARGIVTQNLKDGRNLKINWEKNFNPFEVNFGGYLTTIKEVKKAIHINAIWSKNKNMENVKQEFIDWLTNKPKSNYFNNDEEVLNRYLDSYNTYFDANIFEVSKSNYKTIIETIDKVAYQDENSVFFKYSDGESNHRPRAILGKTNYYQFLEQKFSTSQMISVKPNSNKTPVNQILYGPPGTGKTYATISKAVAIANPGFNLHQARSIIKDEYQRLVDLNQIVFTTFHQSMSYEEFVEGIKPQTKDGLVTYEIKDGIFKKICNDAELYSSDKVVSVSKKVDLDKRLKKLRDELEQSEDSKVEIAMTKKTYHITSITDKHIKFRKASGGTGHDLVIDTLKGIALGERDIIGGLRSYYDYLLQFLNAYNITEENIEENKPFVLIIDEINRGNVSQIFGELITLIEKDKRLGEDEALKVQLPYSKTKFGVPPNLFIVGTMNTADRSVEALDTALRRRFEFKEIMPKPSLLELEIGGISLKELLETINKRIEILLDRDHTIGHSYFIKLKENDTVGLKNAFKNNIIPLLQEYFYGDYEKIGLVLGKGFFNEETLRFDKEIFASFDTQNYPEKGKIFHLKTIDENFDIIKAINILLKKTIVNE